MGKAVIETKGLGKDYEMGDVVVHALRDVDITIDEGDVKTQDFKVTTR